MSGEATAVERTDAQRRVQLIQYAMRTNQWWRARQALDEAADAEDWRVLGYPSAHDYRTAVLGLAPPLTA
jgi:hypothetical protein